MSEADEIKREIDALEYNLDTLVGQLQPVLTNVLEMQSNLLVLSVTSNTFKAVNGIAMLQNVTASVEFALDQAFMFRRELSTYRNQL
jgi:hypothetical protein